VPEALVREFLYRGKKTLAHPVETLPRPREALTKFSPPRSAREACKVKGEDHQKVEGTLHLKGDL